MTGKGSTPRPFSVPIEEFNKSFDRIFNNPEPETDEERYERLEKEHIGDFDKKTGIYSEKHK